MPAFGPGSGGFTRGSRPRFVVVTVGMATLATAGCHARPGPGAVAGDASPAIPEASGPSEPRHAPGCESASAFGSPDRRLTRFELAYAVEDVFGVDASALRALPRPAASIGDVPDILVGRLLDTSEAFLAPYRKAVESLADRIASRLSSRCMRPATAAGACVLEQLREPASRLWRGALDPDERNALRAAIETAGSNKSRAMFKAGVVHLLDSPRFYLLKNESPGTTKPGAPYVPSMPGAFDRRRLATRLALVLWSSVPDLELLRQAEDGALDDPVRFAAEMNRLIADTRSRRFIREFTRQWLRLDRPPRFRRSLEVHELVEEPRRWHEIEEEVTAFMQRQLEQARPIEELLTAESPRAGLLTTGAVLAAVSTEIRGGGDESWLGRGLVVQAAFLCRTFPLAAIYPHKLWAEHPLLDPHVVATTKRPGERALLAMRTKDRPCRECHLQLETIGAALAMFDGFGRAQPSGTAGATSVAGQKVDGPADLGRWILGTERFSPCLAQKLLTYVLGRAVLPAKRAADRCLVRELTDAGSNAGGKATLGDWLRRSLSSATFRGQGAEVVRDRPTPPPTSNAYADPLPVAATSEASCKSFEPGGFLVESCGTSACHGPGASSAQFALADSAKAASLLRMTRPSPEGYCAQDDGFVNPQHPGASLIIRKLTAGGQVCGAPMPIAGGPRLLNPLEHACFARWIEGVARGRG